MELLRLVHSPLKSPLTSTILRLTPNSPIIQNLLVFVSLYYKNQVQQKQLTTFIDQLFISLHSLQSYSLRDLERLIPSVPWRKISYTIDIDRRQTFQQLGVKEHPFAPLGVENTYLTVEDQNIPLVLDSFKRAAGYNLPFQEILQTPFFSLLTSDYFNKEDFIIASELFEPEDGLSPEMILTSPFAYLTHAINPEEILEAIMESGALYTPKMLGGGREDQYPGIYFVPNNIERSEAYKNMTLDVIFVFSLALLKGKAWHINRDEDYGNIGQGTWDYQTLPTYLRSHYNGHGFGELIMHDGVSFDYLEAILVSDTFDDHDPEIYEESMNILRQYDYPVMKVSEFKKLPLYRRVKNLYIPDASAAQEPNFCYSNQGGYTVVDLSMQNIQYTLLNSGYSTTEVNTYLTTKSKIELINLIDQRANSNNRYLPVYHPPY